MVENFDDADETEAETESQNSSGVCDEGRPSNGLVLFYDCVVRILEQRRGSYRRPQIDECLLKNRQCLLNIDDEYQ